MTRKPCSGEVLQSRGCIATELDIVELPSCQLIRLNDDVVRSPVHIGTCNVAAVEVGSKLLISHVQERCLARRWSWPVIWGDSSDVQTLLPESAVVAVGPLHRKFVLPILMVLRDGVQAEHIRHSLVCDEERFGVACNHPQLVLERTIVDRVLCDSRHLRSFCTPY